MANSVSHTVNFAADDDGYRAYLTRLNDYPPIDRETEHALAVRYAEHGDVDAAHRLVCANLRFVVKIAGAYKNYGLRVADLVEEGNIGLLEAIKRFEPDRGLRFMTYAAYWVRAYVLAHILKQRNLVGVGTGPLQSRMFFRLAREKARLVAAGAEPSEMEGRLASAFGTSVERVREIAGRIEGRDVSLDVPLFADGESTALDQLADDQPGAEERCEDAERSRLVRQRMARAARTLPRRERYILEHRLLTDEAETLGAIGQHLGVSRERVRQIEERLKEKLARVLSDLVEPEDLTAARHPRSDENDDHDDARQHDSTFGEPLLQVA